MSKIFKVILFTLVLFTLISCDTKREVFETISYEPNYEYNLSNVLNVRLEGKILIFDEVLNAVSYEVEIYKDDKLIVSTIIGKTSLDLSSYHLFGTYVVKIKAARGLNYSEVSTVTINVLEDVDDVVLEAEDGLLDYTLYKGNNLAHGGAYIGDIDNCGQGVYYNYNCPVAGTYDIEVHYMRGVVDSKHDLFINGTYTETVIYDENTGWGTASAINTATKTVSVNLNEGWNTICLIKNGTESDNYGGWAELDYLVVKGRNYTYDPSNMDKNLPLFRLEAELGAAIKRVDNQDGYKWVKNNTNNPPSPVCDASLGYLRGNFNTIGEGIEWQFNCNRSGSYEVTICYATADSAKIYFYNSDINFRDNVISANDLLTKYNQIIINLDSVNGWDNLAICSQKFILELNNGSNFIYALREEVGYFQIDYIELRFIGE